MTKPLFVIVHEGNIPTNSSQRKEIERIKREERWIHANNDLSLRPEEVNEKDFLYICGAYSFECVLTHLLKLKEARGYKRGTFCWKPASISIREVATYL